MNIAIILAGGQGTRLGYDIPKQYCTVGKRTIISYCLETFRHDGRTDALVVVAAPEWRDLIDTDAHAYGWTDIVYALPGQTRQASIFNALERIESEPSFHLTDESVVLIHDAARPLVSVELIGRCYEACREADGAMPVIPVKDTTYYSEDGRHIDRLLPRNCLWSGQAPEAFRFRPYLDACRNLPHEELNRMTGTTEPAYRQGLNVVMIEGDPMNFKITTPDDMSAFRSILKQKGLV